MNRTLRPLLAPLAPSLLLCISLAGQQLVREIRPGTVQPSSIAFRGGLRAHPNGVLLAVGSADASLIVTDGTPAGTTPLQTSGSTVTLDHSPDTTTPGGVTFFPSITGAFGIALGVTDGTSNGTSIVRVRQDGGGGGLRRLLGTFGEEVVFEGTDGTDFGAWISDGTLAGTRLLAPLEVAPTRWSDGVEFQGHFYFVGYDSVHGGELWITDGTPGGTQMVMDLNPNGSSEIRNLTVFGSKLMFTAFEPSTGFELYRIENGPTNWSVIDAVPGPPSSLPGNLTISGNRLFCTARNNLWGVPGSSGLELFETDGNTLTLVADVFAGTASSTPRNLVPLAGGVAFHAFDPTNGREMWFSDGTAAGTTLLADLTPGSASTDFDGLLVIPGRIASTGTHAVFAADVPGFGDEIFVTDGTPAGTSLLIDVQPGTTPSDSMSFVASNGYVFFQARDPNFGRELWRTDGTAAGTQIFDIAPEQPASTWFLELAALGDRVILNAQDAANDIELWLSDGTAAGTVKVDLNPNGSSFPFGFTEFEGRMWFSASGVDGNELFATDGTANGTSQVLDIRPGPGDSSPRRFTAWRGQLYFYARGGTGLNGLWRSDGSAAGTVFVASLPSGSHLGMADLGDRLLLLLEDELYVTDGTLAGTLPVDPAIDVEMVSQRAVVIDGVAYFLANRANTAGLWRSDGTSTGTTEVYSLRSAEQNAVPRGNIAKLGSLVLFVGDEAATGFELYASDGTTAGTTLLRDIAPGIWSSGPRDLETIFDRAVFQAYRPGLGWQLWITDGTNQGTNLVADIEPNPLYNATGRPYAVGVGRRAFAMMRTEAAGQEIWTTDGTAGGTSMLFDLYPGPRSGVLDSRNFPLRAVEAGEHLYFIGNDGTTGHELYRFPLALLEPALAERIGSSCSNQPAPPQISWSGRPAIGDASFAVTVGDAQPLAPLLLVGSETLTEVALGGGCTLYPTSPGLQVAATADAAGNGSVPVPVPSSAALIGYELTLQWAVIDLQGPFLNLASFTGALQVRLGRS